MQALFLSGIGSTSDSPYTPFDEALKAQSLKDSDSFYDVCNNVAEFLRGVLVEAGIFGVNVTCVSSFAVLWRTEELTLLEHRLLHPQRGRLTQIVRFKHVSTGVEIGVANCVAFATPSQPFSNGDRKAMFEGIATELGAVKWQATNCRWVIGGYLESTEGLLAALASEYKADGINWGPALTQSHNVDPEVGDFAVSQGLALLHVESTVGARAAATDNILAASDNHNLVIVMGGLQSLTASAIGWGTGKNSGASQSAVPDSFSSDTVFLTIDSAGKVSNKEYCMRLCLDLSHPTPLYLIGATLLNLLDAWLTPLCKLAI